jgi:glutathione peroxidase
VNGPDAAPLYKFLKASKPGLFGSRIKWNFTKFLVDKNGKVINRYATATTPFSFEVFLPLHPSLPYLALLSYSLVSNLQKDIQKALEEEHIPARSDSQKALEEEQK